LKSHTAHFESLETELTRDIRPLPNAFKDLEEYKRKMLESMKAKLLEQDDRIHQLEIDTRE